MTVRLQIPESDIIKVMNNSAKHKGFAPSSIIHDELLFDLNDNKNSVSKKEDLMEHFQNFVKKNATNKI